MAIGDLRESEDHKGKGTKIPRNDALFQDSRRTLDNHGRLTKRGAGGFNRSHNKEKNDTGSQ